MLHDFLIFACHDFLFAIFLSHTLSLSLMFHAATLEIFSTLLHYRYRFTSVTVIE